MGSADFRAGTDSLYIAVWSEIAAYFERALMTSLCLRAVGEKWRPSEH